MFSSRDSSLPSYSRKLAAVERRLINTHPGRGGLQHNWTFFRFTSGRFLQFYKLMTPRYQDWHLRGDPESHWPTSSGSHGTRREWGLGCALQVAESGCLHPPPVISDVLHHFSVQHVWKIITTWHLSDISAEICGISEGNTSNYSTAEANGDPLSC